MNKFDKLRPTPSPTLPSVEEREVLPSSTEGSVGSTTTPKPTPPIQETLTIPQAQLEVMVTFTQRLPESTLENFYAFHEQLKARHPKLKMWQVLNALLIHALEDTEVQQKVVNDLF